MFRRAKPSESVLFLDEEECHEVAAPFMGEISVLDVALQNRIPIPTSCEGMGTCGTCRILVLPGGAEANPRNDIEAEIAGARGFAENERLACQVQACHGMKVRILQST